jgi:type III restriction-modification system methyltransferase
MVDIERVPSQSMDIEKADLEKFRAVFPQCFSEGKLDISKLLALFGEYDDNDFEKYKFEWKGKSECYRIAGKRSTGTLRPCVEESVNFDTTNNIYIEGDNLEVLKLLQSSYYNKIKMIYIDPPYNTGNDFVYEDDFADPMAKYKEVTQQTTKSNPETMGRFHTNWLNMMYPRLRLAANLLRDDGVIFISIDENEITNLKKVCNEVFGEENYIGSFIWRKKDGGGQAKEYFVIEHEFIVVYRKSQQLVWYDKEEARDIAQYNKSDERGNFKITKLAKWGNTARREDRPSMYFSLIAPDGTETFPIAPDGNDGRWRVGRERMNELLQNDLVHWEMKEGKWIPYEKEYFANQVKVLKQRSILYDVANTGDGSNVLTGLFSTKDMFENPKPIELVKVFLEATTKDNDIILDFFSGSATTAHAVMQLNAEDGGNRQFIMVQLPELCDEKSEAYKAGYKNICDIGKERIRRAGKKLTENNGQLALEEKKPLDIGFKVFKLDTSNLVEWDSTPTQDEQVVAQRFSLLNETIKPDRNDLDVVYEVMLKMGIPLDYKVIPTQINDKKAYSIGDDCLVLICLDYGKDGITPEDIKEMCELVPAKIVSSEQAFKDSTALSNAYYILKDKGIEMKLL